MVIDCLHLGFKPLPAASSRFTIIGALDSVREALSRSNVFAGYWNLGIKAIGQISRSTLKMVVILE